MFAFATTALISTEAAGAFAFFLHTVHELHMVEKAYGMSNHVIEAVRGHPSSKAGELGSNLADYRETARELYKTLFDSEAELLQAVKYFDIAILCAASGKLHDIKSNLNLYKSYIVRFREKLSAATADQVRAVYLYAFSDDQTGSTQGRENLMACNSKQAAIKTNLAHIQDE